MKRGTRRDPRDARLRARVIWGLLVSGLLLTAAGPVFAWWGIKLSGQQVLHQQISAADAVRGFEFGPAYLSQGMKGRYFIKALVPMTGEEYWHTSFEVLNEQSLPVFRQDELRFIGEYQFAPGERNSFSQVFGLDKQTGYYYFKFTSLNGEYPEADGNQPVVEFTIRQGVLTSWALWGPVGFMLLLGLLLLLSAIRMIRQLGEQGPAGTKSAKNNPKESPLERRGKRD